MALGGLQTCLLSVAAAATAVGSLGLGAAVGAGVWGIDGLRTQAQRVFDDAPPQLVVLSPDVTHTTVQRVVTVRGRVEDAGPVTVHVGGKEAALEEVDGRLEFAHVVTLDPGANTVDVVATDRGGRSTASRRAITRSEWTLSEAEPRSGVVLRASGVEVRGRVSPPQRGEVRVGGTVRPIGLDGRFRFTLRGLQEGSNPLAIEVRPERSPSRTTTPVVVVDSVAPVITLTAPLAGVQTFRSEVELEGEVSDAALTELSVGEQALPATSGPFKLWVPLPQLGKHVVRVTARDRAGHVTTRAVVIERVRPRIDLRIDLPREGARLRATAIRISGQVSGQVPIEELRLTIAGMQATIGEDGRFTALINRREGVHRLEAVARGAGGEARAVRTVTCDVSAPRIAIHSPHDYMSTTAKTIAVRGTISDSAPYVDVRVGFQSVRLRNPALGVPFSLNVPLKVGRNRLVVTSVDSAGNRSTSTFLNVTRRTTFKPPPVTLPGRVPLDRLAVGQGARFGDWAVWRTSTSLLLWVHAGARYAVEMATDSNGWYRYASPDGKHWVVLGLGAAPRPQPLGSPAWASFLTRRPKQELALTPTTFQRYKLTASATEARLENTQLQTTLVFFPKRSTYLYTHPSGKARTFGPTGPVATALPPGGRVQLAKLPVGSGARWGDWAVWRPRASKLLLVHTAERHVVELILDSNGWFRMAPRGGRPIVIYTFGKNTPGTLGIVGWQSYLGKAPKHTLASHSGSLYRYTVQVTPTALVLTNTHFNDTLRFEARSPQFTFSKPNNPKARAFGPTGEVAAVAPPKLPPVVGGPRVSLGRLPVNQGARYGDWTVWRLSRGRLLVTHAADQTALEVVLGSNGWFRFAARAGKQFIVHGYAGKALPQQLSTRDFRRYFTRVPRFVLEPGTAPLQNWTADTSTTTFKLNNRRYGDTLILTPKSSRFRFTKPNARARWFGPKGELKEQ